jgi:hypothetical protein
MTPDGRYVAFATSDSSVVTGDTNGTYDAFVWDRTTGVVDRVSTTAAGLELADGAQTPFISGNGRALTFHRAVLPAAEPRRHRGAGARA